MRALRVGVVLGLLLAASACGGDDDADSSTTAATTTETAATTTTTGPAATTMAPTTTRPPTSTAPATTGPAASTTTPPTTTEPTITSPGPTTEPTMVDVKVYFFRGERLEIAHRQVEAPGVLRGAITEVLAGPTADERAADLTSVIPPGTTLRDVSLADGRAIVDLSGEYESGGGSMSMLGRLGQVIFTATQFDNVDRVVFWLDGEAVEFFGGEGIVLDEPQTRTDVPREFTGGIIIDAPEPGATVRSPFTVTGEGDLFEGYSAMWVWRHGERIAGPFGVTAGAWGTWGEFETTVTLDIAPGPVTLIVDDGNGCTPGDPECGEPNPAIVEVTLAG
ncbi:GerMN domain-containing protein [Ilumatobacter sp.]|uniref:GerMN domain-containing protein n=1 Tax=Ilumatobacter sp. TaxID=1967498 RepID=UPI003AF6CDCD